jgi:hypothetical protein
MQCKGAAINFNAVCLAASVSKTFLYDPKQSDLAQQIRSLRQLNPQSATSKPIKSRKSDSAKDARRSSASKSALGRLKGKFEHCNKKTNSSTAN